MICFNCKNCITGRDIKIFQAELFKHGYRGEQLKILPDLCANCDQYKTEYQDYVSEFEE